MNVNTPIGVHLKKSYDLVAINVSYKADQSNREMN